MTQLSFSDFEKNLQTKKSRKAEFLEILDRIVPWASLIALVSPYYPKELFNQHLIASGLRISRGTIIDATIIEAPCSIKSNAKGLSILPNNFERVCCAFSVRRLVSKNWVNWSDEYLTPKCSSEYYENFIRDSIVFSMFESKSNQSSLRHVEYKEKYWDIKNEFFWMSKDEIMELSEKHNNDICYNDAYASDERYVYKLLREGLYDRLSNEAKAVLDKATDLVRKSFVYRMAFDEDHPEYQINNWDAGFYQLKKLWDERLKPDFTEFKNLYKVLSDKMRPMVYELGFLK